MSQSQLQQDGDNGVGHAHRMSPAARRAEVARLRIEGVRPVMIADQLGVARALVRKDMEHIRKAGMVLPRVKPGRVTASDRSFERVIALRTQGLTNVQIAQELKTTVGTVDTMFVRIKKAGIPFPPAVRKPAPVKKPAAEKVVARPISGRRTSEVSVCGTRGPASGKRPCIGPCRGTFYSPDVSRIRICSECKRTDAFSLPFGW
jgi:DNA-binding CsgD family transcriptional regulator